MTPERLQALLEQGEGQRLEFKQEAIKPADLAQTLVALANAQGGVVLIGVSDDDLTVGVRDYQQAYDLVMTAASHELCDPPVRLTKVELVDLPDGLQVLAVTIPRSRQLHSTHGRFLIRRGSQNISLTTAEVADRSRFLDTGGLTPLRLGSGIQALYEVLRFDVTLELLDARGSDAMLMRDQAIRFLQNGVVGLYHQVWGAGQLFAEYDVHPGVVADRFKLGSRHITLISLRQVHNRGDVVRLRLRRRIKDGWTRVEEWLEIAVSHRTRSLRVTIIFPAERPASRIALMEKSTGGSAELDRRHWRRDKQGRSVLVWREQRPTLGETYLLRWSW